MPDIFLYSGEANQSDVKLRDPTVAEAIAASGTLAATDGVDILLFTGSVVVSVRWIAAVSVGVRASHQIAVTARPLGAAVDIRPVAPSASVRSSVGTGTVRPFAAVSVGVRASHQIAVTARSLGAAVDIRPATPAASVNSSVGITTVRPASATVTVSAPRKQAA